MEAVDEASTAVAEPAGTAVADPPVAAKPEADPKEKRKRQPRHHVVLWNDEDHTYEYVIEMLQKLFGHPAEKGYQLAKEVDLKGKAVVLTTTKEHAELKRDQIHAYGRDRLIAKSKGSMSATIEPEA